MQTMSPSGQNSTNLMNWLLRDEDVDLIFLCFLALLMYEIKLVDNLHIN